MKREMKEALQALREHGEEHVIRHHLTCGMEVEFGDGGDLGGAEECPYTTETAEENLSDSPADTMAAVIGNYSREAYAVYREILRHCDLSDFVDRCTGASWSDLVENELESLQESWESEHGSCEWTDVDGWEHKDEGTEGIVREYVSDSGTYDETVERIEALYAAAGNCVVPKNGSNHVHVSVTGCHHTASDKSLLHCCVLYEMSQLVHEMPDCVLRRCRSSAERYFRLDGGPTTKFTAVHWHPQGSVEFRLFGHCCDSDDARVCLSIACRAFVRAYARFYCGDFHVPDVMRLRNAFRESIIEQCPMSWDMIHHTTAALPIVGSGDDIDPSASSVGFVSFLQQGA